MMSYCHPGSTAAPPRRCPYCGELEHGTVACNSFPKSRIIQASDGFNYRIVYYQNTR